MDKDQEYLRIELVLAVTGTCVFLENRVVPESDAYSIEFSAEL